MEETVITPKLAEIRSALRRRGGLQLVSADENILHVPACPLSLQEASHPIMSDLFQAMVEFIRDPDHLGVGLAAPQVGLPLRIIVVEINKVVIEDKIPAPQRLRFQIEPVDPYILINPRLVWLSPHTEVSNEACLSFPGQSGQVSRYWAVKSIGLNHQGQFSQVAMYGWHARVLQHEMDHLDGLLWTDRQDWKY